MSFCHKLKIIIPISVQPDVVAMKSDRFTPSGFKEIEIRKFEFVAKTQFL